MDQDSDLAQQKMLEHLGHFENEMIEYYRLKEGETETGDGSCVSLTFTSLEDLEFV